MVTPTTIRTILSGNSGFSGYRSVPDTGFAAGLAEISKNGPAVIFLYRERCMIIAIESNESGYWGLYWKRNRQGDRKPTAQHFFAKKDGTGLH